MEKRMRNPRREIYCRCCFKLIYPPIFLRARGWMIVMFLPVNLFASHISARTEHTLEVPTFLIAGHETSRYIPSSPRHDSKISDLMIAMRQRGHYMLSQSIQIYKPNYARNFSLFSQIIQPWMSSIPCRISTQWYERRYGHIRLSLARWR